MAVAVVLWVLAAGCAVAGATAGRWAPPAVVRTAVVGAVVAAVLLALAGVLFALVAGPTPVDTVDTSVLAWMVAHRSPGLTTTAEVVSLVGGTVPTGTAGVLAGLVLLARGRRRWAVVWVVGVLVGSLVIRLVKLAVERPRPPVATRLAVETTASLPSGHSLMAALGLGLVAAAVVVHVRRPAAVRAVVVVAVAAVVALIGASRAYLGVHWTTDVLAGWFLGAAIATVCLTVARVLDERAGRSEDAAGREPLDVGDRPVVAQSDRYRPSGDDAVTRPDDATGR